MPEPTTFISKSPEETFEFGYKVGEEVAPGTIFLLTGDLGAGKTVFAKGLAAGLGIDPADVASPTFTLINEHKGRLRLYHIDLYRLEPSSDTWYSLGLDEIISEPNSVVIIEWAERLGNFSVGKATDLSIEIVSESGRRIRLSETYR
ncbi:MAG TPA: tRNA (adenosine(37)-N6)-threonylcarbamoyltransferase complex ATPase subunit type 1 TsaE [Blastocatellia bacterium]|nr:tRNA (adenosine(37)-N6)-threonylcarbamoyltransferase complex ATPase subunit type 1 TsaE [Blastocatellia bacterium]